MKDSWINSNIVTESQDAWAESFESCFSGHPAGENYDNHSQLKKVGSYVVSSAGDVLMLAHLNAVVRSGVRDVHLLYKDSGVGLFPLPLW